MLTKHNDFKQIFLEVTKKLIFPAGDSEKFSSLDKIRENRDEFIIRVHDTWKQVHTKSIEEIMNIEKLLKNQDVQAFGKDFIWFMNHSKQLWRRINDSIIWSIFSDRHIVKRLCLYRQRPPLIGANIDSELQVLNDLNKEPYNIAILNDATYFVDIGDITLANPKDNISSHIEIKEGKVNEIITDIFHLNPNDESFKKTVSEFFDNYGEEGFKQFERYYKQQERNNQMLRLLKNGEGYEPYTQQRIKIQESFVLDDYYDDKFDQLLEQIKVTKDGVIVIDDCLWIYASYNLENTLEDHKKRFLELIINNNPMDVITIRSVFDNSEEGRVIPINEWISQHVCIPLFLRNLSAFNIAEIVLGKLLTRVFMFFDWNQFGQLFKKFDGSFIWSSKKTGRREKSQPLHKRSCLVIDDRIPQISFKRGISFVTGANLIRILFDGLKPSVLASQLSEFWDVQG
ncbi:MAG: hypothetical protein ACUZ8I_12490 [Candidatus Scalindua sp.]